MQQVGAGEERKAQLAQARDIDKEAARNIPSDRRAVDRDVNVDRNSPRPCCFRREQSPATQFGTREKKMRRAQAARAQGRRRSVQRERRCEMRELWNERQREKRRRACLLAAASEGE